MEWAKVLPIAYLVLEYIVKVVAVGIVPENRKPGSAAGWLVLILFVPIIGVPLFLALGNPYTDRRRRRIQADANQRLSAGTRDLPDHPEDLEISQGLASLVRLNRNLTSLPMVEGRDHGIEMDTRASYRRMAELVDAAESYVHMGFYITAWDESTDPLFQALVRASARGVKVRVLFDHLGSRKYPGFRQLGPKLTAAGIDWHLTLPFQPLRGRAQRIDLRNHRKSLIVDGRFAVMGSLNMIDPSYLKEANRRIGREWVDIAVELSGPIVASIEATFAVDWFSECGEELDIRIYHPESPEDLGGSPNALQLIPSGPGFLTEPNLRLFTSLIHLAQHRVRIVSPYFVPDESLLAALITAAHRGVVVDLHVGEKADQFMVDHAQSSYYDAILDAGVRIVRYPSPAVLHTKCFTIDDVCAVLGSSNMDMRSFGLNYEISLLATGGDLVAGVHEVIDRYAEISTVLDAEEWAQRSLLRRWMDSAMRLTSALQ